MKGLTWISYVLLSTLLALIMQLPINSVFAQATNTSLAQNNDTIRIVDSKNNTISIIDPKTNQIVSVENLTANATSGEVLTPENRTINQTQMTK